MGCIQSKDVISDPNTFQVVYADSKEGVFSNGQLKVSRKFSNFASASKRNFTFELQSTKKISILILLLQIFFYHFFHCFCYCVFIDSTMKQILSVY